MKQVNTCVVGAVALALIGCGGGGHKGASAGTTNGGGAGASAVSDAVRFATLDKMALAVDAAIESGTSDAQLAATLRALPGIVASGTSDTGSLYAEFADGRVAFVSEFQNGDAGDMDDGASDASPALQGRAIPGSRSAYLFDTIGPNEDNPVSSIVGSMAAGGYAVQTGDPFRNASVDALKTVRNAAAFFISTHGGAVDVVRPSALGKTTFTLTSTKPSPENDAKYRADLADDSLNYVLVRRRKDGTTKRKVAARYCFTRNFVAKYMTFAPHAVAAVDSCSSYAYPDMAQAFRAKGATYLGWSNRIATDESKRSFSYFFDRLVGANAAEPAEPGGPQRPFGYAEIFAAMGKKTPSLAAYDNQDDHDPNVRFSTVLKMTENDEDGLAPSIETLEVDEAQNRLRLEGEFSDEAGTVRINGHNLTVESWDERAVVCDLPVSGADSSGDVQAFYQGRASNVRTLTEWNGTVDYVYEDIGTLKETMRSPVRFRADADRLRHEAGQDLQNASHAFDLTGDVRGDYQASGSYRDETESIAWSGSTSLGAPQVSNGYGTSFYGGVANGKIWFSLGFFQPGARRTVIVTPQNGTQTTDDGAQGLNGDVFDHDAIIETPLTESLVFPGGSHTATIASEYGAFLTARSTLKWSDLTPTHLPHSVAAR